MSAPWVAVLVLVAVVLDAHSTWLCLRRGYRETNILLRRVTPRGILIASFWLWLLMMAALLVAVWAGRAPRGGAIAGPETQRAILYVLCVASFGKIIAAIENYQLARHGRNLGSRLFGWLLRHQHPLLDLGVSLLLIILPAMLLAGLLFPEYALWPPAATP